MGAVHGGIKYLTGTETAILVPRALRERWPQVKFSVRSGTYSGGASIDVSWFNGPPSESAGMRSRGGAFCCGWH